MEKASVIEILIGDSFVAMVDIGGKSPLPVGNFFFTISLIVIHSRVVLWPIFVTAIYAEFLSVILT